MKKTILIASLLIAVLSASLFYLANRKERIDPKLEITLIDGQKMTFGDLQGKPLLVVFWATSCTSCMQELPILAEARRKNNSFEVLAVAMSYDEISQVKNYINSKNYNFKFVHDTNGNISRIFNNVKFTPTSFMLDKNGNIQKMYIGNINKL